MGYASRMMNRPANRSDPYRRAAVALAFVIPFSLYLVTLAPTVTLEDSGELIAAAYTMGVPHSPGYPLFAMFGKLFSLLPVGSIAWRLNLMSAFFASLAALFSTCTTGTILGRGAGDRQPEREGPLRWAAALAAGLWLATSFENWEQAIITEVYALNTALITLFLGLLASRWRTGAATTQWPFVAACGVLGLALTAHPTSLILLPLFALHVARNERASLGPRRLMVGALAFCAGLAPYLYLPLASLRDPGMDWGNPETLTGLFRALFVRPHRLRDWPSPGEFLERIAAYVDLLADQWAPVLLLFAAVGLIRAFRSHRDFFWHASAFLLLSGPVVTLGTNVDVSLPDAFAEAENLAQVSVFYIPSYAMISILMGVGLFHLAGFFRSSAAARRSLAAFSVVLPIAVAVPTCRTVDMSDYHLAEDYAANLFAVAQPDAVVLADWDPFYFPLVYFQIVEHRRPDLVVLDVQLLRRSWYVEQLLDRHPSAAGPARPEIDAFLAAVRPFEEGEPFDATEIQSRYERMLRVLVGRNHHRGREVYFTFDPPPETLVGRPLESVVVAWRITRDPRRPAPVDAASLEFRGLTENTPPHDRWQRVFRAYYGTLAYERGTFVEDTADYDLALANYRLAEQLLPDDHVLAGEVRERMTGLERRLAR